MELTGNYNWQSCGGGRDGDDFDAFLGLLHIIMNSMMPLMVYVSFLQNTVEEASKANYLNDYFYEDDS